MKRRTFLKLVATSVAAVGVTPSRLIAAESTTPDPREWRRRSGHSGSVHGSDGGRLGTVYWWDEFAPGVGTAVCLADDQWSPDMLAGTEPFSLHLATDTVQEGSYESFEAFDRERCYVIPGDVGQMFQTIAFDYRWED